MLIKFYTLTHFSSMLPFDPPENIRYFVFNINVIVNVNATKPHCETVCLTHIMSA